MQGRTLGRIGVVFSRGSITVSLLLSFFVLAVVPAQAAVIKTVQRGTASFASGQNTLPVTLTAVDPTKTIVWGGINWGGGRDTTAATNSNANATRLGFDLANTTTLNLQRLGAPTNLTAVEWQAIEFLSGVSVQRGAAAFITTAATVNVPITAVNLSESFVLALVDRKSVV